MQQRLVSAQVNAKKSPDVEWVGEMGWLRGLLEKRTSPGPYRRAFLGPIAYDQNQTGTFFLAAAKHPICLLYFEKEAKKPGCGPLAPTPRPPPRGLAASVPRRRREERPAAAC